MGGCSGSLIVVHHCKKGKESNNNEDIATPIDSSQSSRKSETIQNVLLDMIYLG